MKKLLMIIPVIISLAFCSSFVTDEEQENLKLKYEVPVFKMIQDVEINGKTVLRKGDTVKLILAIENSAMSDSFVKVYAYKYENEDSLLKSDRSLIVYIFDTEFKAGNADDVNPDKLEPKTNLFDEKILDSEIRKYVTEKK